MWGRASKTSKARSLIAAPKEKSTTRPHNRAIGDPDPKHVSTSFVERQNWTLRTNARRYTRLSNGFSRKLENHAAAEALTYFAYSFIKIHRTLRMTLAMAAGVTDRLWDVSDLGDVPLPSVLNPDLATKDAEGFYRRVHELGIVPITVGGDHSITTPILRAISGEHSRHKGPIGMIHFDAHSDTYPEMGGTRHHAGAAFRIGVEENLIDPARTIQIGLHGPLASLTQDDWSRERFTVVTLEDMIDHGVDWVASEVHRVVGSGPAYLSFDLDVIDIAYAPAVADPEVNGLMTRELFALLNKLRGVNLVGADIVCFCPPLDSPAQITALTASEILLQFVAHVACRHL